MYEMNNLFAKSDINDFLKKKGVIAHLEKHLQLDNILATITT
jgi:hypothetical protein